MSHFLRGFEFIRSFLAVSRQWAERRSSRRTSLPAVVCLQISMVTTARSIKKFTGGGMAFFFNGFEFGATFSLFLTESLAVASEQKEEKIYPSSSPCLRSTHTGCIVMRAEARTRQRGHLLAALGLLMSMTVAAPTRAEYFYTAPQYDGWVIAGEDFRGTFGDSETALQKYWENKC